MSRPAPAKSAGHGAAAVTAAASSARGGTASNSTSLPVSSRNSFVMPTTFIEGSLTVGFQFGPAGTSGSGLDRCQSSMTGAVRRLSSSHRSGALLVREICAMTSKLMVMPVAVLPRVVG